MNEYPVRYVLNFPEIDVQHEYLYSLFDRIELSFSASFSERMKRLLKEIENYLLYHFNCEEHLMRIYSYPEFAVHQSEHEQTGIRLAQFLEDFEIGTLNPKALQLFLSGWLMEHSSISDIAYVSWIKEKRNEVINI